MINNRTIGKIKDARGGKRAGAGRPKGAVNKATAEAKAAVEESGETPLEYMIRVMRDPKANARRRDAMAAAAAPTCIIGCPRLSTAALAAQCRSYDDDDGAGNVAAQSFAE